VIGTVTLSGSPLHDLARPRGPQMSTPPPATGKIHEP
jgi:hypothetical protein